MEITMAAEGAPKERQRSSDVCQSVVKKRNMKPGRRICHGRIYDSELGYTCHWCRQKTVESHVFCCKCSIKFCGRCLSNRNGEDIHQEMLDNVMWVCPKCRGGCGPGCRNWCVLLSCLVLEVCLASCWLTVLKVFCTAAIAARVAKLKVSNRLVLPSIAPEAPNSPTCMTSSSTRRQVRARM